MKRRNIMKTIIKILTALACLAIFWLGALTELTVPAIIIAAVCFAWLGLVGFATLRRSKR